MWQSLRRSSEMDPMLVDTSFDLLRSTSRALAYLIGFYALAAFLCTAIWPEQIGTQVIIIAPMLILVAWMALRAVDNSILLANTILIIGLAVAFTMAAYAFQLRELAYGLALLPFVAMVTVGWPLAVLSLVIMAISLLILRSPILIEPVTVGEMVGILMAGGFVTWLAGTSSRTLLTVAQWSVASYQQALASLEELRERRAELAQLVRELDRTTRSLERANSVLVLARAAAEQARKERNRLALAVSHELRTPLNFVIGFSELMVSSPETYAPLVEWPQGLYDDVQEIYRSSSHLLGLVNDVIDLGQMESLQTVLFKDWVDPQQILYEIETMVRPAFARKDLYLRVVAENSLPAIYVDRVRIRQVLLNVVTNSLRFTTEGGVSIMASTEDDAILISVQDTGSGIPEEDIPNIFEPFKTSSPESWRQHEGAGLGLSISHRLIELHGGDIWVEHTSSEGTMFCFTLPTGQAIAAQRQTGETADERFWRLREERAERESLVLACSPQPNAGEILAAFVGDVKVVAVPDPERLAELVDEIYPRALLLDQELCADLDLSQLAACLPYDLPIIVFPFPGRPNGRPVAQEGVLARMVKPIERQELLQTLSGSGVQEGTVLVLDDDAAMARFVRRLMASPDAQEAGLSLTVVAAYTGAQALELIRDNPPAIAILDMMLPDMNGWDLLDELREGDIPAVLMTGHENQFVPTEVLGDALRLSMARPLSRQELRTVLSTLLAEVRPTYPSLPGPPASTAEPAE